MKKIKLQPKTSRYKITEKEISLEVTV